MKLKITSDGSMAGTRVETDDGEDITSHVRNLQWTLEYGRAPIVQITLIRVDADLDLNLNV